MIKVLIMLIVFGGNFVFSENNKTEIIKDLEKLQSVIDNSVFLKKTPWKVLGFKEKPDDMRFIVRLEHLFRLSHPENWIKAQEELSSTQTLGKILIRSYKVLKMIKDNYRGNKSVSIDSFSKLNLFFEGNNKIIITLKDDIAKYFVEYDLSKNILISYPSAYGLIGMVPFETTNRYKGLIKLLEFENFGGRRRYKSPYIRSIEEQVSQLRGKEVVDMEDEKFSLINERTDKIIYYFNDLWPKADKRIYFYTSSDTLEDIPDRPNVFKEILFDPYSSDKCRGIFNKLY